MEQSDMVTLPKKWTQQHILSKNKGFFILYKCQSITIIFLDSFRKFG